MNDRRFSAVEVGTMAAFLAALFIRFIALGRLPLTDSEASLAMQAFSLSRGSLVQLAPQPGYILLTAVLFFLNGSGEVLARFWPALMGSMLVLVPLLFRRSIGARAALILAFLIAFDPGMVAISRQADSGILAIVFVSAAAGFFINRRMVAAGIFAALALLSGPHLWPGILSIGAAGWITTRFDRQTGNDEDVQTDPEVSVDWKRGLISLLLTLLIVGTLFYLVPTGIGAAAGSLPAYLSGWIHPVGVSPLLMVLALVFYEIFVLAAGAGGVVACLFRRSLVDRFLGWWFFVALVLVLVYPSRQVTDLAWPLLPLLALAARWIARFNPVVMEIAWGPAAAQAVLTVVLLVFTYLNLNSSFNPFAQNLGQTSLRLAAVFAALALLALTSGLMVLGWGRGSMQVGLLVGLLVVLGLYQLSAAFAAGGLGRIPAAEMWSGGQVVMEEDLLMRSVNDFGLYTSGEKDIVDVTVVALDLPSLRWALRDIQTAHFVDYLPTEEQPQLVITPREQTLALGKAYRGQDFAWTRSANWGIMIPSDWMRWLVSRQAPEDHLEIILWARTDIFPGAAANPAQ